MSKALLFLKKIVTLSICVALFFVIQRTIIPLYFYISIPLINLAFALIVTQIIGERPKELYNYNRNEKFFARGGMRDLLRIPTVLFAFVHDLVVWEIWGIYHIFYMFVEVLSFIKDLIYWLFFAVAWFIKILIPFWRITFNIVLFYLIKWPWWIFRYAYQNVKKTFNWNMLRIALPGSFLTLLVIDIFFYLDILLEINGVRYIGMVLALLPLAWVFGEISALRGQDLENASFSEIKIKFRNGIESVRGILTFLTFFVVLVLAEAGFNWLGWIPKSGIIFLGLVININFIINLILIFLAILICYGTIVLPSYRLYKEFSETSLKNVVELLSYIGRRFLQYIAGLIPSSFFASITIIPITILVILSLSLTLRLKDNILDIKINKLEKERLGTTIQIDDAKIGHKIQELKYYKQFPVSVKQIPTFLFQEVKHRNLLLKEIDTKKRSLDSYKASQEEKKLALRQNIEDYEKRITDESQQPVINQTRLDDLQLSLNESRAQLKKIEDATDFYVSDSEIALEYMQRRYKQFPAVFFFSGLFFVVILTLIITFLTAYLGNFFYNSYIFRNDGKPAQWRVFIRNEQEQDDKQPLLSTTLNIILIVVLLILLYYQGIFNI